MDGYYSEEELDELTDDHLKEIEEMRSNLFDALIKALNENGIEATIDRRLGEIALDNSVLFSGDSSVISAAGKDFLKEFVKVYTDVIYDDQYSDSIARVVIEGHTAPLANSTYESGLPLST